MFGGERTTLKMNVNWTLRHELRRQKMTGTRLAAATGMSPDSARMFLNGPQYDLRLSTLERIADAVDLELKLVKRRDDRTHTHQH